MFDRQKFRGTGIAIVTPFLPDGQIDWEAYQSLIEFWIKGGVEYLVVLGTTGESATVRGEEKKAVIKFVKETVKNRVGLMVGIGGNDTREVLEELATADLSGYDAILSVSPYYNRPNQEGLFQHYKALNDFSPLPIMMYNVPGRTGQNILPETQVKIAHQCKNIFATKEASGNLEQVMHIIKYKPKDFMVISGDDALALPMIALGATGVVSVVANAYPKEFSEMIRQALSGNFEEARRLHYRYTEIIQSLFAEGSPAGIKTYLSEMKLCLNMVRPPLWPVSESHYNKIRELMKTL